MQHSMACIFISSSKCIRASVSVLSYHCFCRWLCNQSSRCLTGPLAHKSYHCYRLHTGEQRASQQNRPFVLALAGMNTAPLAFGAAYHSLTGLLMALKHTHNAGCFAKADNAQGLRFKGHEPRRPWHTDLEKARRCGFAHILPVRRWLPIHAAADIPVCLLILSYSVQFYIYVTLQPVHLSYSLEGCSQGAISIPLFRSCTRGQPMSCMLRVNSFFSMSSTRATPACPPRARPYITGRPRSTASAPIASACTAQPPSDWKPHQLFCKKLPSRTGCLRGLDWLQMRSAGTSPEAVRFRVGLCALL